MSNKAYLFYRSTDNGAYLYAHTDSKELKNKFIEQRGSEAFKYVKSYLNDDEYDELRKSFQKETLTEVVVNINSEDSLLVMTHAEDFRISEKIDIIETELDRAYRLLMSDETLSDEEMIAIKYLISGGNPDINNNKRIEISDKIDDFGIFLNSFKETFRN